MSQLWELISYIFLSFPVYFLDNIGTQTKDSTYLWGISRRSQDFGAFASNGRILVKNKLEGSPHGQF
jgi:hypothetical protein